MWALNALPRLNLPVAVFLKRLAAPLWLLSLGMFLRSFAFLRGLRFPGGPLGPGLLRQDGVHLIAFLARRRFGDGHLAELVDQPLEDPAADLRMRHFAPAEENRRLDLVPV